MGNELKRLKPQQQDNVKANTHFSEQELVAHIRRYMQYDNSDTANIGIQFKDFLTIPELAGFPFAERLFEIFTAPEPRQVRNSQLYYYLPNQPAYSGRKIFLDQFIFLWAALSPKASAQLKRSLAFDCFDTEQQDKLQYSEVFTMYKLIFTDGSQTDDEIARLTFSLLQSSELKNPAVITYQDFCNVASLSLKKVLIEFKYRVLRLWRVSSIHMSSPCVKIWS